MDSEIEIFGFKFLEKSTLKEIKENDLPAAQTGS